MDYAIFTDTSANLPGSLLSQYQIHVIPLSYIVNDQEHTSTAPGDFDAHAYYTLLSDQDVKAHTSLAGTQRFMEGFQAELQAGRDILFIGMSSGISGTYQAAVSAAEEIAPLYPERRILTVDTHSASLAEGLCVLEAVRLREAGVPMEEIADRLLRERNTMHQVFTVSDLHYLHRGGRISGVTAIIGSVLHIHPILQGDTEGKIRFAGKVRGRRKALLALADDLSQNIVDAENQIIAISHADCPEDAEFLAGIIAKSCNPKDILIEYFEPVTGSHVGPGAIALFYRGKAL